MINKTIEQLKEEFRTKTGVDYNNFSELKGVFNEYYHLYLKFEKSNLNEIPGILLDCYKLQIKYTELKIPTKEGTIEYLRINHHIQNLINDIEESIKSKN